MNVPRGWLVVGPVLVTGYAVVMVLRASVWDPVAAVPSMSHPEIIQALRSSGVNVIGAYVAVTLWGAIGPVLAVVVSILGAKNRLSTASVRSLHLAILAAGAPALFIASFPLGMDVADTFGVGGGAHTPWTGVLYLVSAAALVALLVVAAAQRFRPDEKFPLSTQPRSCVRTDPSR